MVSGSDLTRYCYKALPSLPTSLQLAVKVLKLQELTRLLVESLKMFPHPTTLKALPGLVPWLYARAQGPKQLFIGYCQMRLLFVSLTFF